MTNDPQARSIIRSPRGREEYLPDHLLIQSLLDYERRLESIEQKVNLLIKELSILEEVFGGQRDDGASLNREAGQNSRPVVYLRAFFKILESLSSAIESEEDCKRPHL